MRNLIALVMVGALASPGHAGAREIRRLAPSTQWVVNYANESCSLGRGFGEGSQKVTVFFDQLEPGDTFNLTFVGKSMSSPDGWEKATVRFGPNEAESETRAVAATTKDSSAIILQGGQRIAPLTDADAEKVQRKRNEPNKPPVERPPLGAAREKAATWLQLGKVLPFDVVFETGEMDAPLAALRDCSWDMVRSWGLDVEQQKHRSAKAYPVRPASEWFSSDDYPVAMLRVGAQAIVNFRILVDAAGKASSCKIQTSTRPKEFDDLVCRIVMRRAKFHPALDAQGKPIPTFWRQTVTFRMAM